MTTANKEKGEKKEYSQEKSEAQVKKEIVHKSFQIRQKVRDTYQHDAKPIFIDKG